MRSSYPNVNLIVYKLILATIIVLSLFLLERVSNRKSVNMLLVSPLFWFNFTRTQKEVDKIFRVN